MFALFYAYGGPFSTFQGLWGYPYLIDVLGYDKLGASNLIMVIAFGVIAGGPLMAHWVDKTFARKKRQFFRPPRRPGVNWFLIAFLSPDSDLGVRPGFLYHGNDAGRDPFRPVGHHPRRSPAGKTGHRLGAH
jgi:hypothetical protein